MSQQKDSWTCTHTYTTSKQERKEPQGKTAKTQAKPMSWPGFVTVNIISSHYPTIGASVLTPSHAEKI